MPYSNVPKDKWGAMDRCVEKVMAQGKEKENAIAICHSSIVKSDFPLVLDLEKGHVKAHTRQTKSGKIAQVKEHGRKHHFTVHRVNQDGSLSHKEHLNHDELDDWMERASRKHNHVRVERNDGRAIHYTRGTTDEKEGEKWIPTKKEKFGKAFVEDDFFKSDIKATQENIRQAYHESWNAEKDAYDRDTEGGSPQECAEAHIVVAKKVAHMAHMALEAGSPTSAKAYIDDAMGHLKDAKNRIEKM